MQEQPFKPEHRDYFNKQQRGYSGLPHCPFCGTGYVTPVAPPVSTDFEGLVTDQNGTDVHQYKQAFKCTKPWCRTEFDVVYRAMYAEHVVVPEDVVKKLRNRDVVDSELCNRVPDISLTPAMCSIPPHPSPSS
jgi:hypothetical protein